MLLPSCSWRLLRFPLYIFALRRDPKKGIIASFLLHYKIVRQKSQVEEEYDVEVGTANKDDCGVVEVTEL